MTLVASSQRGRECALIHPLLGVLVAQRRPLRAHLRAQRPLFLAAALLSLGVAACASAHATDFSPGGSVHDPAMVLLVLATTQVTSSLIAYLQRREPAHAKAPARGSLRGPSLQETTSFPGRALKAGLRSFDRSERRPSLAGRARP